MSIVASKFHYGFDVPASAVLLVHACMVPEVVVLTWCLVLSGSCAWCESWLVVGNADQRGIGTRCQYEGDNFFIHRLLFSFSEGEVGAAWGGN